MSFAASVYTTGISMQPAVWLSVMRTMVEVVVVLGIGIYMTRLFSPLTKGVWRAARLWWAPRVVAQGRLKKQAAPGRATRGVSGGAHSQ